MTAGYGGPPPGGEALAAESARALPFWRSGLFWRMISGALVAFLTMVLTAGLALLIISALMDETQLLHASTLGAARVRSFSTSLDHTYNTLDLLLAPNYNPRVYEMEQGTLRGTRAGLDSLLTSMALDAGDRQTLAALARRFDDLYPRLEALNVKARTDQGGALVDWRTMQAAPLHALSTETAALSDELERDTNTRVATVAASEQQAQLAIPLVGLGGLLLGCALSVLALRRTVRRIAGITAAIERLAGGDLRPPVRLLAQRHWPNPVFADEVVTLEQAYIRTLRTLHAPLQRIQEDASRISATSTEMSTASYHQASNAHQQATAITEVTVTVEELNQTAVQIADAATSVAAAAEQALVSAGRGQEAVRDSIIGMAMIRSRVNDITSRILALSAQSQRISEIIDVIDEMAGRTHILALNAAVESAGAGGQIGERFGVVASEVKKLAQRSAGATREVRAVIAQVQAATNAAVMATEDGLKETEKGVQMAHQSGDANEDIIQLVERTAQLANAISLATQQQRTGSEQVVATMREVAQATRQAAAGTQQTSRAATDLSDIAQGLRQVSDAFQIEAEPGSAFNLPDDHPGRALSAAGRPA